MKQICLVGPIDKRPLAYPLLKAIDLIGKCLVITDDANFRRFADNYEREFNKGNSDFVVVNDITKYIAEELGYKLNNYDFVLFITTNTLMDNNDITVYCHGSNKCLLTEDVLDELQDIEDYKEVLISQGKVNDKKIIKIDVNKATMGYVWACEENKEFVPCKVSELAKVGSSLFANLVGLKTEEYIKILMRKEG